MSACEHCWTMARMLGIEYHDQISKAEQSNSPCTHNTIEGAKLRAGQWWDEEKQRDRRTDAAQEPRKEK